MPSTASYRSRLAPTPTGYLHLGHARTFWIAQQRAQARQGALILRNEDLDRTRCRPEYTAAMFEDLLWIGLSWCEGPDIGGPFAPYSQSERMLHYIEIFERLRASAAIYPCFCSRQDILQAINAPHLGEEEPIYPGTCRPQHVTGLEAPAARSATGAQSRVGVAWRFRVPDGETVEFIDGRLGPQRQVAGVDFGDFVIWRKDDLPAYQLACAADDAAMQITEVVRGADLVTSTFRQLLLYQALGFEPPSFYHCDLLTDAEGRRLAKRDAATSLRTLREQGATPEELRHSWAPL